MPEPLIIGLIGHSTKSDNLGVGALSVAEVNIVRLVASELGIEVRFLIFDWKDRRTSYVIGSDISTFELNGLSLISPTGFFAHARKCDLVIDIGGGDSFAEIYGLGRLLKILLMKYQVHLAAKPIVLAPQTYGPFKSGWSQFLAKLHIRLAKAAFSRDELSMQVMENAGLKDSIELASDVALKLPYSVPDPERERSKSKIGFNISGLLMNGGYTKKNQFGLSVDYPRLVEKIVDHFSSREGCELHLVPHVLSHEQQIEDDYRACERIHNAFPTTVLAPYFEGPSEAKSYIAGMDFFLGARMHSCIAAFSSGVPVVPMAYSRKFEGMFGALGYPHTVDCVNGDEDALFQTIVDCFEHREKLSDDVAHSLKMGRERLGKYEAALSALLLKLSSR